MGPFLVVLIVRDSPTILVSIFGPRDMWLSVNLRILYRGLGG